MTENPAVNIDDNPSSLKIRYKTVLIGDGGVGKTSLKRSFLGFDFIDNYEMTIGAEASIKRLGKNALQIWDLGGQRGFQQVFENYFLETDSAIVVFDITNPKSFENVPNWIEMITITKQELVPTILVGNKSDLRSRSPNEISYEHAMEYAQYLTNNSIYEIPYVEASALTGLNVPYIFEHLILTLKTLNGQS
ncbi:MAG: GTP-binding protein [Candidatus Kariarchaeaceae archaeon]|jgi:small GTP-binding protein